jgi:hypothetical protein
MSNGNGTMTDRNIAGEVSPIFSDSDTNQQYARDAQ